MTKLTKNIWGRIMRTGKKNARASSTPPGTHRPEISPQKNRKYFENYDVKKITNSKLVPQRSRSRSPNRKNQNTRQSHSPYLNNLNNLLPSGAPPPQVQSHNFPQNSSFVSKSYFQNSAAPPNFLSCKNQSLSLTKSRSTSELDERLAQKRSTTPRKFHENNNHFGENGISSNFRELFSRDRLGPDLKKRVEEISTPRNISDFSVDNVCFLTKVWSWPNCFNFNLNFVVQKYWNWKIKIFRRVARRDVPRPRPPPALHAPGFLIFFCKIFNFVKLWIFLWFWRFWFEN